jgi:hypothetical protein
MPQTDATRMDRLLVAQLTTPLLAHDVMHKPLVQAHQLFQALCISTLSLQVQIGLLAKVRGRIRHGVSPFLSQG